MRFDPPLVPGRLLRRYKRFLADVELADGSVVTAHCANSGSMLGTNLPGSPVLLSRSDAPTRKLPYTLELIQVDGHWIGVNTMRPNALVHEAIAAGGIPELDGYPTVRREVVYGQGSRVDLLLEGPRGLCYVEVKGVSLAVDDVGYFPDAVTERGAKHLDELRAMVRAGHRAVLFYVVHRGDCSLIRPADAIDPHYGRTLRRVARSGVEVLAYRASVAPEGVALTTRLEVCLSRSRKGWRY